MSNFLATSSQESTSSTVNGILVTASATATATSTISQQDAQTKADAIAKQNATSDSQFSANLLNQSIIVDNLQQYTSIIEGYALYSEILSTQNYVIEEEKYTLLTSYANLYDKITNAKIGTWGNFKQISINGINIPSNYYAQQQYYIVIDETGASYTCNRVQNSQYIAYGKTDIATVVSYADDTITPDQETYVPHIWRTRRSTDGARLEITILKSATNSV
uniref:Uncharacterized protein n=1 Tax=viral metagenome TaxID=1070528 RepID=A0A6C0BAI2_9ZZZZ